MSDDGQELCSFYLGEQLYGVPVSAVREIIRGSALTTVPLADDSIAGLINVRGNIVVVVDPRIALAIETHVPPEEQPCLLVTGKDGIACIRCDRVSEVRRVRTSSFVSTPGRAQDEPHRLVPGAFKLDAHGLLHLLDVDVLLQPRMSITNHTDEAEDLS